MKITTRRARIARDSYCGYEVQVWTLWWPFWRQPGVNTHCSEAEAESFARYWLTYGHAPKEKKVSNIVKEVTK